MSDPIRVGLVGAGPWAGMFHAPMLAAGPQTRLEAVLARRREAAEALANRHGARVAADMADLVASCDAVALAVPPDVQARLAPAAAAAGLPLLLEKPIGLDLDMARRLRDAVGDVPTMLMLRGRFSPTTRAFLARADTFRASGLTAVSVNSALLGANPFGTPWRREHGALLDIGPHLLDLAQAAAGPIRALAATGSSLDWVALTTRHEGGAVGQIALSLAIGASHGMLTCRLYGRAGVVALDPPDEPDEDAQATTSAVRVEFAEMVRTGVSHPLDVGHGLRLQEWLEVAARDLAS